ncbi:MAG: hypothetical protein Q4G63_06985 [Bacteroidia bacterium]|nr:hypothetical protein [Bacteroidia bacterium]
MKNNEALETVKEIRMMMEKSSRFTSFSGTSAILIGVYALVGALAALRVMSAVKYMPGEYSAPSWIAIAPPLIIIAISVFAVALGTIVFFSIRKATRAKQSFFNKPAIRTFINFFIPLVVGGVFCVALLVNGNVGIIAPGMLLFYGLSLVNASKYTYDNIFWLGCAELILGLLCAFFPGKGLLFWSLGFGVLHIIYGIYFYVSIERKGEQS